ncbi:MAG: hypothetical protein H0U66_14080 [Gemmatimonadaceae bacterium]|nr:hypothetical protein [Gemmatimonadaceae bacterium]
MRLSTRLLLAAAVAVIAATTACGSDSTGPPGGGDHTPGTLAQHFDTLYARAKASSVSDTNYNERIQILSDLELAAAFGASPTSITVTTASGTESWNAFVFEEVRNIGGAATDSAYVIVAYRDSLVHTAIVTGVRANGTSLGASLITNDTLVVVASANSGVATLVSSGGACPAPIAGLVNPIIATGESATCVSAVIQAAHTSEFPARTGVPAAYMHFSFAARTFAGERFFDPPTSGGAVLISSSLGHLLRSSH